MIETLFKKFKPQGDLKKGKTFQLINFQNVKWSEDDIFIKTMNAADLRSVLLSNIGRIKNTQNDPVEFSAKSEYSELNFDF